jgi:hypothetical protein
MATGSCCELRLRAYGGERERERDLGWACGRRVRFSNVLLCAQRRVAARSGFGDFCLFETGAGDLGEDGISFGSGVGVAGRWGPPVVSTVLVRFALLVLGLPRPLGKGSSVAAALRAGVRCFYSTVRSCIHPSNMFEKEFEFHRA